MSQHNNGRRVCQFWTRALPEHHPIERKFARIDEHFVKVGAFIKYDPVDKSPRYVDPPNKRPRKNRERRRAEMSKMMRANRKGQRFTTDLRSLGSPGDEVRTDVQRWANRKAAERKRHTRTRARLKRRRAAR